MFNNAARFNQPLASWNTSNVTTMMATFQSAALFNQNISGWNASKVAEWLGFRSFAPLTTANTPPKFR